jgi:hypothetical protein
VAALSNKNDSLDSALIDINAVPRLVRQVCAWDESDSLLSDLQIDEPRRQEFGGYRRENGDEVGRAGRLNGGSEDLAHRVERRLYGELADDASVSCPSKPSMAAEWRTWAMLGSGPSCEAKPGRSVRMRRLTVCAAAIVAMSR